MIWDQRGAYRDISCRWDASDRYLICNICVCTWLCVWSLLCFEEFFDTQHFLYSRQKVCELKFRNGFVCKRPPETQTVQILSHYRDRWAAVTERAGCMHVMDHCSRARRCRFSLWHFFYSVSISPPSWSEVLLRRLKQSSSAHKLLFDISACFFSFFGNWYSIYF